ncbi:MAG: site-2 protease family protein [Gemmataceae bacterium]
MMLQRPDATPFDLRFTLFGTPIRVHPFFWLITVLLAQSLLQSEDWVVLMTAWVAAVFISILLHEFGHVWMWRVFGVEASIVLQGLFGLAIPEGELTRRWQRVLVSCAGPAIQLVFYAVLLFGVVPFIGGLRQYPTLLFFLGSLLWINLVWPLINLLPVYPLDGGQIAREVCQMAATRSEMVNSRPALIGSLWLSIATAAAVAFYVVMPSLGIRQPYPLNVGPVTAIMCVLFAVGNFQELQRLQGRRGPMDDDW